MTCQVSSADRDVSLSVVFLPLARFVRVMLEELCREGHRGLLVFAGAGVFWEELLEEGKELAFLGLGLVVVVVAAVVVVVVEG